MKIERLLKSAQGCIGTALLLIALGVTLLGPLLAQGSMDTPVGLPGDGPSMKNILGLDLLGRDVLTRVAHGGISVVFLATLATLLSYAFALPIGLAAGYARGAVDNIFMRLVDLILAFPALVVPLLLAGALGASWGVLVIGAAISQLPTIARVTRAATQEIREREYVDAAIGRGETKFSIIWRDVMPNVAPTVLAGIGLTFGWCVIVIASMNYLGLGLQPPASDWGLMIAENQQYVRTNPLAILAPAILLAMLTVGISLITDAYSRLLGTGPVQATAQRSKHPRPPVGKLQRPPISQTASTHE